MQVLAIAALLCVLTVLPAESADARASAWQLVRASGELTLTLNAAPRTPCGSEATSGEDWVERGTYKLTFTGRRATNDRSNIIYKGGFGAPTGGQAMALDIRSEASEDVRSALQETDEATGAERCVVQASTCAETDTRTVRGSSNRVSVTPTRRLKPVLFTLQGLGAGDLFSCAPRTPDPFDPTTRARPREDDGQPIIQTRVPIRRWVPRRPRIRLSGRVPVSASSGPAELSGTLTWQMTFTFKRIVRNESCSEFGRRPSPFVCD